MAQHPIRYNEILVRTVNSAPASAVEDIRNAITALDPDLPVLTCNRPIAQSMPARSRKTRSDLTRLFAALC
jgi:hypothetical protein